jgi:hypothetical protein
MKTVINFISGPGCGKSVCASLVFAELKMMHLKAEYVQEYAKSLIYEQRFEELNNQYNVSMSQYKSIKAVSEVVDFVVTDSPLLLGIYYNRTYPDNVCNVQKVENILINKLSEFQNIYIFLERNHKFDFETSGRVHTHAQSIQIDEDLKKMLTEFNLPYKTFLSDRTSISGILDYIFSFKNKHS